MDPAVIVLNGVSSAGKSTIARCLQAILPDPWLTFGVDYLIDAMPVGLVTSSAGVPVDERGQVRPGPVFRELEVAWRHGIAAMVGAGVRVILDEVFLEGGRSQARWADALRGSRVLWVAVRCDLAAAEARERARGDRVVGMARSQAPCVHEGVAYDLEVDTTSMSAAQCARRIADRAAAGLR